MTVTFAHPPHPAPQKNKTQISEEPQNDSRQHDPHTLPSFELRDRVSPVLYLFPLLSPLPENIATHNVAPPHPPLITETRLPDIDPASLSLHKELHHFRPLTANYAETPYEEAFNWSDLRLPAGEEREWYCVTFQSQRKAGSNGNSLYEADKLAHEEAVRNGGLILYWYGIPHPNTGMNLATCIWQSRRHAIAANSRPQHIKAMRLAAESYQIYTLNRYRLCKTKGQLGVTIEPYTGGEVGW